jgi:hypothetical protein
VIAENFAAKLSTSPQLTVQGHQLCKHRNKNKPTSPYSKHAFWKKKEHFSDVDIQ